MTGYLMKERPKKKPRAVVYLLLLPSCLILGAAYLLGIRPNLSFSLPPGLYIPAPQGPLVTICPDGAVAELMDRRGYRSWGVTCPNTREALLKAIAAYPGDLVAVTDRGVSINGKFWPTSQPLKVDSKGRPLPVYRKTLHVHDGMVWVMGLHPKSFDSRYFGEVPTYWIVDRMRVLWTWR